MILIKSSSVTSVRKRLPDTMCNIVVYIVQKGWNKNTADSLRGHYFLMVVEWQYALVLFSFTSFSVFVFFRSVSLSLPSFIYFSFCLLSFFVSLLSSSIFCVLSFSISLTSFLPSFLSFSMYYFLSYISRFLSPFAYFFLSVFYPSLYFSLSFSQTELYYCELMAAQTKSQTYRIWLGL